MSILNTRARRPVLVGSLDPRVLPRHLARQTGHPAMPPRETGAERAGRPRGPGTAAPLGRRSHPEGGQLQRLLEARPPSSSSLRRPWRRRRRRASSGWTRRAPSYHYWHAPVPASGPPAMRTARTDRSRPNGAGVSTARRCSSTPRRFVVAPSAYGARRPGGRGDNAAIAMRSVVCDPSAYDWEGDVRPRTPFARTLIYEMHMRGFTRHPSPGAARKEARDDAA